MSGELSAFILVAVAVLTFGSLVTASQLRRFPAYSRRAEPLIEVTRSKTANTRPAELHQLIGIVSKAMLSEASEQAELRPLLNDLGYQGPPIGSRQRLGRLRTKSNRAQQIEQAIAELEADWGLHDER